MSKKDNFTFIYNEQTYPVQVGSESFEVTIPCPCGCGHNPAPLLGTNRRIKPMRKNPNWSDTYTSDAFCKVSNKLIPGAAIELKVSTLFGLEEDEAVYRSGVTIY